MEIAAISDAANNAELMVACRELGYLSDEMTIVDPTYGYGRFWTDWSPQHLMASDLNVDKSPTSISVDATDLPLADSSVDAVVLDPPYKLNGASTARGPAASDEQYGVDGPYVRWQDRHNLICDMLIEAARVVRNKGFVLLKCQDQVCSGQVRWQTVEFTNFCQNHLKLRLVDWLFLVGQRPQPEGRSQKHARRNYSSLLIFKKENK
jgi:hypothetical protein